MNLLTECLKEKPFRDWTTEEVNYILTSIDLESEYILKRNSYFKYFMSEKRKFIQPLVNKIYDEIFTSFGKKVTVKIELSEYNFIKQWAETSYLPYKKRTDYGYKGGDVGKTLTRLITGTCGNLAVIKYYGGTMKDIDLSVGASRSYAVPDLKNFLGGEDIGVKTARTGSYANLPLVLDYSNFTKEYIKTPSNKNKSVEAQLFVGQNEANDLKFYIIGAASPRDIINGTHRAFTLDPKAMSDKKAGGAKGGFYAMHKTIHCSNKEELLNLLKRPEFKMIPYGEI